VFGFIATDIENRMDDQYKDKPTSVEDERRRKLQSIPNRLHKDIAKAPPPIIPTCARMKPMNKRVSRFRSRPRTMTSANVTFEQFTPAMARWVDVMSGFGQMFFTTAKPVEKTDPE
jgi:hypothetical protein